MIAIILAGGGGTRLWPYSQYHKPKQFMTLGMSSYSLLQNTYQRLMPLIAEDQVFVVGNHAHQLEIKTQLCALQPHFSPNQIISEPSAKNTAAAVLLALLYLLPQHANESVVVLPSDHFIPNTQQFQHYLRQGDTVAQDGRVVIFGVQPTRPETGFGYIRKGCPLGQGYEVTSFMEKPDFETAISYLHSADYFWNSGMVLGQIQVLLEEFQRWTPQLYTTLVEATSDDRLVHASQLIQTYESLPSLSFDCAVLEHSQRVSMVPMDLAWSDVGSWEGVQQILPKDSEGNTLMGNIYTINTSNSLIIANKPVACIGIDSIILVETEEALLICDSKQSQLVKQLVSHFKMDGTHEA